MEIRVSEKDGIKSLDVDGISQGRVDSEGRPASTYLKEMLTVMDYVSPWPPSILSIGLGPGLIPTYLWSAFKLTCDIVEPSEEIISTARDKFGYVPRGVMFKYDGAVALKHHVKKKYNLIFLDAYNGWEKVPHLYSRGFYSSCYNKLEQDGYFVSNFVSTNTDECWNNQGKLQAVFGDTVRSTSNKELGTPFNAVFFAKKILKEFDR